MTPERPLQAYAAQVSECTDVRIGVPLPMGILRPLVYPLGSHSSAILLLRGPNQQQGQTALEKAA